MNTEKVVFAFFVLLAAALNLSFVWGDVDNPLHHPAYELFAALIVNLVATVLKLGDRSHLGGALMANVASTVLLIIETANVRR